MPGRVVSSTSRTFFSAVYRLRRSQPVMTSTRSTDFDIGARLGFHLGPHGCAGCPVEIGCAPHRRIRRGCVPSVCCRGTASASGIRTKATADSPECSLRPGLLSSVPNRPSQEVRRELASGERFSAVSVSGQSTGLTRKPQETCHSARRSVCRRAGRPRELAERVSAKILSTPIYRRPVSRLFPCFPAIKFSIRIYANPRLPPSCLGVGPGVRCRG